MAGLAAFGRVIGTRNRVRAQRAVERLFLALDHAAGRWFDRRAGVATVGYVMIDGRGDVGTSDGYHYVGVPAGEMRVALRRLRIAPTARFVDLGCGKGRALVVAAQHGFTTVHGVDFKTALCAEARANLTRYQRSRGASLDVEILNCDAATYVPDPVDSVFFAFNPFPGDVLAAVVDNIAAAFAGTDPEITFVYLNPVHVDVFADRPEWRPAGRTRRIRFRTDAYRLDPGLVRPTPHSGHVDRHR